MTEPKCPRCGAIGVWWAITTHTTKLYVQCHRVGCLVLSLILEA